ncbi:BspA family leucine-rich repeat surface protein [Chryseobacterium daecheongense]|uniref:BspA family leucine-rich repeat surface protein n=1 Tax=Chryseobacterium sp. LAM-KRS1 TaxID=2715754 RepID=UPI001553CAFA|nr:BspA family leucine-rich repeat surface protein [Chryseobacterium sp. LAM-KRS1]WBV56633.1 BspA family leucine-rich repeat surface protein [Chryseobacterium daecheongense]
MYKKIILLGLFLFLGQMIKAQNEFVTIWQPNRPDTMPLIDVNAPYAASTNQIWFPGIGENYTISWEEVNYPQHNGVMNNVTSTKQVLIDFGTSLNPDTASASYRVKVSNGNGIFKQIRFGECQIIYVADSYILMWDIFGNSDKITEIENWGNIQWTSMNTAFAHCRLLQLTATDSPNLTNVTDASFMFYNAHDFLGASSMQNWNTSTIKDFKFMFARMGDYVQAIDQFNSPYLSTWNMSSAKNLNNMFSGRKVFNQPLNNWNTSNVEDMGWMFALCLNFNQRLDSWDTSKVKDMSFMFHFIPVFNQDIGGWNTSSVTNMAHMFHGCTVFNQPLNWATSQVTHMGFMLTSATNFNRSLGNWNLSSLTDATNMLTGSGLNCDNYSKTLSGWADNPVTPDNIPLVSVTPLQYASNAASKRNILIGKGWNITGDTVGNCLLSTSEIHTNSQSLSIYPNPAEDNLHIRHAHELKSYKILDASGRLVQQDALNTDMINISSLTKGNYILQITTKNKTESFKLIKK